MESEGVDFYLLKETSARAVDTLACRVVEKAWRSGRRVLLLARDEPHVETLDELLWTFSQGSFVPHATLEADPRGPVCLAVEPPEDDSGFGAIVTLKTDPVAEAFHHLRIADIIGAGEAERRQARQRYRYYREYGLEPRTHHL